MSVVLEHDGDADPGGDGTTTYHWREGRPMAPYLATVTVGRLDQSASDLTTNPDRPLYIGIDQSINATNPGNKATMVARQQRVPAILDWYAGFYGVPYPFEAAGGIVPRVGSSVGYVLRVGRPGPVPAVEPPRGADLAAALERLCEPEKPA